MMRLFAFILSLFLPLPTILPQSEKTGSIQIIDISQKQIRLMNRYWDSPGPERDSIMADSLYEPYEELWLSYISGKSNFLNWLNTTGFTELESYNTKAERIDLAELNAFFLKSVAEMQRFTGHRTAGKWYIFFGPKWINLGGFDNGTMLIDLAHDSNQTSDDIKRFFPHEINHQIYSNFNTQTDDAVLYRILDEGFACYVSYLYNDGKTSKAEELDYTQEEYEVCKANEGELLELLKAHYLSNDEQTSDNFANRAFNFSDRYPGAIGYYLGFRIAEEYVKRNGADSWKQIYTMKPVNVLLESGLLEH